ncbi:unnamed protein product [Amoebophrya sp. A25]|nr:unnamed protein product [Amoebophrya sp. A25]|eukprot:GSA25T00003377001.1
MSVETRETRIQTIRAKYCSAEPSIQSSHSSGQQLDLGLLQELDEDFDLLFARAGNVREMAGGPHIVFYERDLPEEDLHVPEDHAPEVDVDMGIGEWDIEDEQENQEETHNPVEVVVEEEEMDNRNREELVVSSPPTSRPSVVHRADEPQQRTSSTSSSSSSAVEARRFPTRFADANELDEALSFWLLASEEYDSGWAVEMRKLIQVACAKGAKVEYWDLSRVYPDDPDLSKARQSAKTAYSQQNALWDERRRRILAPERAGDQLFRVGGTREAIVRQQHFSTRGSSFLVEEAEDTNRLMANTGFRGDARGRPSEMLIGLPRPCYTTVLGNKYLAVTDTQLALSALATWKTCISDKVLQGGGSGPAGRASYVMEPPGIMPTFRALGGEMRKKKVILYTALRRLGIPETGSLRVLPDQRLARPRTADMELLFHDRPALLDDPSFLVDLGFNQGAEILFPAVYSFVAQQIREMPRVRQVLYNCFNAGLM